MTDLPVKTIVDESENDESILRECALKYFMYDYVKCQWNADFGEYASEIQEALYNYYGFTLCKQTHIEGYKYSKREFKRLIESDKSKVGAFEVVSRRAPLMFSYEDLKNDLMDTWFHANPAVGLHFFSSFVTALLREASLCDERDSQKELDDYENKLTNVNIYHVEPLRSGQNNDDSEELESFLRKFASLGKESDDVSAQVVQEDGQRVVDDFAKDVGIVSIDDWVYMAQESIGMRIIKEYRDKFSFYRECGIGSESDVLIERIAVPGRVHPEVCFSMNQPMLIVLSCKRDCSPVEESSRYLIAANLNMCAEMVKNYSTIDEHCVASEFLNSEEGKQIYKDYML